MGQEVGGVGRVEVGWGALQMCCRVSPGAWLSTVPESVDDCGTEQSVHELKGEHLSMVFLRSSVQGGPTVFPTCRWGLCAGV